MEVEKANLVEVVRVDEDKCVNCHACIAACPVKYCNNGSGDHVEVNSNMCIACGKCIDACTHEARQYIDDFDNFIEAVKNKEKIIAIVAPSIVASFPENYLNLNGWLKSIGVNFIYDVSFGAELTVKSYIEHINKNEVSTLIAQPCPAIVSYIELYKPELIKYLAPVDSPMLHSIKMIKNYYPEYKDHKVVVISPCVAKKREFDATKMGDFIVTIKSLHNYFIKNDIDIDKHNSVDFDNPKAERAVLFSSPGGLLKTTERWIPAISEKARKIEGVDNIYPYLDKLPEIIEKGISPLIVDCLNCDLGCNAGPATLVKEKSVDEIEYHVSQRSKLYKDHYSNAEKSKTSIEKTVNNYWNENLYKRDYVNLWYNVTLKYPNKEELEEIYVTMHKYSDEDIYNCVSCGYNSCENMATAIFNGLNKPENCHHYLQTEKDRTQLKIQKSERRVNNILETANDGFVQIDNEYLIQNANEALCSMLKRKDIVGRSFLEFLDEENKEILFEHRKLRTNNIKSSYELTFTQSDGGKIICFVSGTPMLDENDNRIGSFAMISDITELKDAETKLRESHQNLEQKVLERTEELNEMLEELRVSNEVIQQYNVDLEKLSIVASEIDNATIIMDIEGNFEWVNSGFTKMFGLTNDQVKGKNIITNSTSESIKNKIFTAMETCKPISYEFEYSQNGSPSRWIQVNLSPILDGAGEIKKIIAIDTDITALKEKEFEIINQKEEIEAQRDSIEKQRDLAKQQAENIQASITYASRIQDALLPGQDEFKKHFPEHFIMYYPKDIVSGDFYWISERNGKVYLAAADCTGHGVPGAFMSMLGITYLNEIMNDNGNIEGDIEPHLILNKLKANIVSSLNQRYKVRETKDGMDMALCVFDLENRILEFSGAQSPVFILRNGEIIEIKGDKMPIGYAHKERGSFIKHTFNLLKDDQVYLFSDGITDQFNGVNRQKLMKRRFKELILAFGPLPMKQQFLRFTTAFDVWQGKRKQVDDMLLIGLKIP